MISVQEQNKIAESAGAISTADGGPIADTFAVFDIETAPLDDATLMRLCPEFVPPPPPGEFDPASVKCGNLGPAKAQEKIAAARAAHMEAVESYEANISKAAADHFAKFKDKAALDATTGRVVAIGLYHVNGSRIIDCDGSASDEEAGLRAFWSDVEDVMATNTPMIGFNTHNFDLPFLVRRSWILGVPVPMGVRQGRYWNPLFIDLMKWWAFDGRDLISLDTLAAAFGLPGKIKEVDGVPVDGASFYLAWRGNRPVAEAYLRQDLKIPALLAQRMGVV